MLVPTITWPCFSPSEHTRRVHYSAPLQLYRATSLALDSRLQAEATYVTSRPKQLQADVSSHCFFLLPATVNVEALCWDNEATKLKWPNPVSVGTWRSNSFIPVLLHVLQCTGESPGDSDSVGLGWGLRSPSFSLFAGNVDTAGLRTTPSGRG